MVPPLPPRPPLQCLLLGATGGCGSRLLPLLLSRGVFVTVFCRSPHLLPSSVLDHPLLSVTQGEFSASSSSPPPPLLYRLIEESDVVVAMLGHTLTFKGIFGEPKRLCTDVSRTVVEAAKRRRGGKILRYIALSSDGVDSSTGCDPPRSFLERSLLSLLLLLVPPHADNVENLHFLEKDKAERGEEEADLEFVAVRPSNMWNEGEQEEMMKEEDVGRKNAKSKKYLLSSSLQHSLLKPGWTSRENVARFVADLVKSEETEAAKEDEELWKQWVGKAPEVVDRSMNAELDIE